ncbi:MAG: 30S ribosomal protein S3, partial [Candidatus Bathyarchaeota archaeon]
PELNPQIMGSKITSALARGIHFRRSCYWALNNIIKAGALGVEIIISGKLTSERSRREKFKAGYIPKVGDPAMKHVKRAVVYIQLKPGLTGVRITIIPPDYRSPDKVVIKEKPPEVEVAEPSEEQGVSPSDEAKETEG